MLPDWKDQKLISKFRKRVRYYDTSTVRGNYNAMPDNSLYEDEYSNGTTEQLADNIIAENILS